MAAYFVANVNAAVAKPFVQVYMLARINDDPVATAVAYVPSGLVSLFLAEPVGRVVDRTDQRVGIAVISVLGAVVTGVLVVDNAVVLAADLVISNAFSRVSKRKRGRVLGLQNTVGPLGATVGPLLGGFTWDVWGPASPFLVSIVVELALVPIFFVAFTKLRPFFAERLAREVK
ncbi:MAG: hypothetical protein Kow0069_17620 [Promethearchaeota archaeon]